jgi:hypothetical protein
MTEVLTTTVESSPTSSSDDPTWDHPYPREVWEAFERQLDRWERRWKKRLIVHVGNEWMRYSEWEATPPRPERLPGREDLLRDIASRLLVEANEYVPQVLSGRPDDGEAPLRGFIMAQGQHDPAAFQLPEPLLGPVGETTQVLVVGLNPRCSSHEDSPRLHATLDDYVNWFANRMAAELRNRRYGAIERDYLDPVLGHCGLGRGAVYADAIPWKWNAGRGPDLGDTAVLRYARGRIAEIASVLQPEVLVSIGVPVAEALGLDPPQETPNVERGRVGYWEGQCLVLFHPNRRWPARGRAAYNTSVQQLLRDVFSI